MSAKKWITHKPDSVKVPHPKSKPQDKTLFRFVRNGGTGADDFLPSCIDPEQCHMRNSRRVNWPEFHATSFFLTQEAAQNKIDEMPERFDGMSIAVGDVKKDQGYMKVVESKHVSVWFYEGVYPKGFQLVQGGIVLC